MSKQKLSRTPQLDMDKCVKNAGDNKFDMVIYGAARAREIARKHRGNTEYCNPVMSSLLELEEKPYAIRKIEKI